MTSLLAARYSICKLSGTDCWTAGMIGAWVLSMIALPLLSWLFGSAAISWGVLVTALLQVGAVFVILVGDWGWRRTAATLVLVGLLTGAAEVAGSKSGLPFGYYHYTELLQPQVVGVPLLIPLAWFMMLPPAWAVAQATVGRHNRAVFTLVSALAMTAWDFFLDPQKVAWGFWVWTDSSGLQMFEGGYFGIPWTNYVGWLLVAALVTWLARPARVPVRPLLLVYAIVWVLQAMGQLFFWNLPGPAFVGFVMMGSLLLWVWRAQARRAL